MSSVAAHHDALLRHIRKEFLVQGTSKNELGHFVQKRNFLELKYGGRARVGKFCVIPRRVHKVVWGRRRGGWHSQKDETRENAHAWNSRKYQGHTQKELGGPQRERM